MFSVNKNMRMVGDEDGGVGLQCDLCPERMGRPVAYYTTDPNDISYREYSDVVRVTKIDEFITAGKAHLFDHYPGEDN
jgi:hypothetical protein